MAIGHDLLQDGYAGERLRVFFWNGEDPFDEWKGSYMLPSSTLKSIRPKSSVGSSWRAAGICRCGSPTLPNEAASR